MSRESVDVQINAKDQSEVQTSNEEVKPWYVNYQPKTPNLFTVGGYVEAKKQKARQHYGRSAYFRGHL